MASFLQGTVIVREIFKNNTFSSLSESGFIPTVTSKNVNAIARAIGSHLFQRVASFLPESGVVPVTSKNVNVLISFREWLHSYRKLLQFNVPGSRRSSHLFQRVASFLLNEKQPDSSKVEVRSHLFQRVASFLRIQKEQAVSKKCSGSHLFQRVASFLQILKLLQGVFERLGFSSLSESGFIPTWNIDDSHPRTCGWVLISFREWLHSYTIIILTNSP